MIDLSNELGLKDDDNKEDEQTNDNQVKLINQEELDSALDNEKMIYDDSERNISIMVINNSLVLDIDLNTLGKPLSLHNLTRWFGHEIIPHIESAHANRKLKGKVDTQEA